MTYKTVAEFAQTTGLVYFALMFAAAALYALWPRNRERFERAARMPLSED